MKYKTLVRLLLKLLGVFLFASSGAWLLATACIGSIGPALGLVDYAFMTQPWTVFYGTSALIQVIVGLYLLFSGRWLADRIVPSNRPYCHECGYDLSGSPAEGACPECGTAYRRAAETTRQPPGA
jgi:hypothetical protein